jgi:hypothetical protein
MLNCAMRVSVLALIWFMQAYTTSAQQPNWLPVLLTPSANEVMIHAHYVQMPVGRILLIRKGADCCAIKFTKFWTGKTEEDYFGSYERYYQGDGSADFTKLGVIFQTDRVSYPRIRGSAAFPFQFGAVDLRCGSIQLEWGGNGKVTFITPFQHPPHDAGVELAPTPWTDISEVNAFDSRVKWYRLDSKRRNIIIPIDQLFDNPVAEKKQSGAMTDPPKPESKRY